MKTRERDAENSYLALDTTDDDPLNALQGHSISYRIALGPQAGRKVFTLQTLPPVDIDEMHTGTVGQLAGFNLHAGVAARADERRKLERLWRYICRPVVSEQRLSLTTQGKVRYHLKTPYRDGTTHVVFEPQDFISRLAVLARKTRVNLTRYHGVYEPNSQRRALVTPARRGRGNKATVPAEGRKGFEGGIMARKYEAITKCSNRTASRDLSDLVGKGVHPAAGWW